MARRDTESETATLVAGTSTPGLRVIVVDDHPLYRQGIVRALESAGEVVVAEAGDGLTALDLMRVHQPDVGLVDVSMPGFDGIDLVGELARHGPDVPVVLLSAFSDESLVRSGLKAGAAAYVTKSADRDEIIAAVSASAGPQNTPRALAVVEGDGGAARHRLSSRERELLTLARRGADEPGMAAELAISLSEVRTGLSNAIVRLSADTLRGAVRAAEDAGLLR